MIILTLNVGSSSIKFQLVNTKMKSWLYKGKIDNLEKTFEAFTRKKIIRLPCAESKIQKNIELIIKTMNAEKISKKEKLAAVAHRVVHGGEKYTSETVIDKTVIKNLEKISELAPLHNPFNIQGIKAAQAILPKLPHIAVFDTGFYKTLPEKAWRYAVPVQWYKKFGIRKYGFHGISHEYVTQEALKKLKSAKHRLKNIKIITCHLGNGCSITASIGGKTVDTSMGFTPLEGVVMGTRSGNIDPAVVTYLAKKLKCTAEEVINKLNRECGLKAISETSEDMRVIRKRALSGDKKSLLAMEIFCYSIAKQIGAFIAAMRGIDAIIFTGGIGENAQYIRDGITQYLGKIKTFVIPTNEELAMALKTQKMLLR